MALTFDQLEQKLAYIGKAANGVVRSALGKGSKVLVRAMQAAAPVYSGGPRVVNGQSITPGRLKASIGSRVRVNKSVVMAKAGIEVGQRPGSGTAPHAHLVAAGTAMRHTGEKGIWQGKGKPRRIVKTGNPTFNRGRIVPGKFDFIKKSTAASGDTAWGVVVTAITEGIERAAIKQGL